MTDRIDEAKTMLEVPHINPTDLECGLLDIFIVAFLIYQILVFIKGARAVQMVLGLGLASSRFLILRAGLQLETVTWLLTNVLPYFVFAIISSSSNHEIRRALARFGQGAVVCGLFERSIEMSSMTKSFWR